MQKTHLRQRAFTLVEVITVVAVIGISGAVAAIGMSDQIIDARGKAESRLVVQQLRAEHRAAREQMVGLKVTTPGARVVQYQHTRGEDCAELVGQQREVVYDMASLRILSPASGACFNARGEPDPPGGIHAAPEPIVMAVDTALSGTSHHFVPLRIDRAGIVDLQAQKVSEEQLSAIVAEFEADPETILSKEVSTQGIDIIEDTTANLEPFTSFVIPPGSCMDGTGLAIECPQ